MNTGIDIADMYTYYQHNPQAYRDDQTRLQDELQAQEVKYGNYTLHSELVPLILDGKEYQRIREAAEAVISAAEMFTDTVVSSPDWQERFAWSRAFRELVLTDPGYDCNIPCARFDSFLRDGTLTFIELNTDGCSGMTNADLFGAAHQQVLEPRGFETIAQSNRDHVVPHVLRTLLECYRQFRVRYPEKNLRHQPTIGILDWANESTHWEFTAFEAYCREQGICAKVVSPESLHYDGGTLYAGDEALQLVYRRMLGIDYAENMAALQPVTAAFLERNVCMVGAPRSQIAFSKKLFAFLQDPAVLACLPEQIAGAVHSYIPWTRELREMETGFKDETIELLPFILENKDAFVIKPCVSKCGAGIYQGRYTESEDWNAAVRRALSGDYIVQEFIELATADFPRFTAGTMTESRYIHIGEYVFGGRFSGFLGRTCGDPLLNLRHGERLLSIRHRGQ